MGERWTGLFTKRPQAGRVKTRLFGALEPEEAARFQEAMLADAVERLRAGAHDERPVLAYAPPHEAPWFETRFDDLTLVPQLGEGLAERMAGFFERAADGRRTVVMTGSDQPLVTRGLTRAAHEALEAGADVVLGPDLGGGYYLVGLRRPVAALFREVEMSVAGMYAATLAVLGRERLRVHELEPCPDVDTPDDLERLKHELARRTDLEHVEHVRRFLASEG